MSSCKRGFLKNAAWAGAAFGVVCAVCFFPSHADAFTIAKRGEKATCVVSVPAAPSACLRHAAEEFSAYVKRMTGVELPVVCGDAGGKPAVRLVSGGGLGRDSFRFRTSGSDFLIEGDDDRSVLFGVYDFLENHCGCDWLSADQEVVPERSSIEVADGFDLLKKPAFRIRESSYADMRNSPDFAAKMKLNGYMFNGRWKDIHGGPPAEIFDRWLGKCHTFMRLLPPEKYFKDHPEYYAEVDGKREYAKRMQLCLTNPDVVRIVTSNVLARIANVYPKVKIFGVSQSDRWVFCTCRNCAAVDAREGSHAGTNIEFVNKIADAVAEKYPDVLIETLAYQYTCKPPRFVRPRPNVMVCLCSDYCDFSKPLGKSRYRFRKMNDFVDDLRWWCAEAKRVHVWNYTMNFRYHMHAFPNVYCLKPDLETFLDCGVTEVFEQGVASPHQAGMALKTYLIGHLLWDPRQPFEPLLDRFYRGYYGAAAPWMRRYMEELHAMSRDRDEVKHPMKMWGVVDSPALKTEFFERGAEYFARAAEAVKDDPVRLRNVQWEMNANDYTRIMRSGEISDYALRRDGKYPVSPKLKELQAAARRIAADWKTFPGTAKISEDSAVIEASKRRIDRYAEFDPSKATVGKCVDIPVSELSVRSGGKYLKLDFSDIHIETGSVCRVEARIKVDLPADAKVGDKVFGMFAKGQPKTGRSYFVRDLKPDPDGFGWYGLRNPCDIREGGCFILEKSGKHPVKVDKVRVALADITTSQ